MLTHLYQNRIRPVLSGIDTAHPIAPEDVAEVERRLIGQALQDGRDPNCPEVAAWRAYTQHHARMLGGMMAAFVETQAVAARASRG
jgi:hypothetical protein